jgi:hypothetical protein
MYRGEVAEASDAAVCDSGDGVGGNCRPQITWRRANEQDVIDFYGEPSRRSLKANAIELDGQVVGMIGVVRHPEWGMFFTDYKPQLQPYLSSVTVWRAIKDGVAMIEQYKGPVLSVAEHVDGCINLNRLGFSHMQGAWYAWLN